MLILGMNKKIFLVSILLLVLNQLSGINVVLSYSKQLLMKVSYYNEEKTNFYLLILAFSQIVATLTGGWLINKYGRKRILIIGGQVVTVSLFAVFIVYSFSPKSILLLVSLIVMFTLGYSATIGVIPMIYLG
jgi:SP family xylose:H+ symportor-like MFS transporter